MVALLPRCAEYARLYASRYIDWNLGAPAAEVLPANDESLCLQIVDPPDPVVPVDQCVQTLRHLGVVFIGQIRKDDYSTFDDSVSPRIRSQHGCLEGSDSRRSQVAVGDTPPPSWPRAKLLCASADPAALMLGEATARRRRCPATQEGVARWNP